MNEEAMRKAFEAWARGSMVVSTIKGTSGHYIHDGSYAAWVAWQAATRAAVPEGWKVVPAALPVKAMNCPHCDGYIELEGP